MRNTISIRIPEVPPDLALQLVPKMAEIATRRALGHRASAAAPTDAVNPCEEEGCAWVETFTDGNGVKWHAYDCDGTLVIYRA